MLAGYPYTDLKRDILSFQVTHSKNEYALKAWPVLEITYKIVFCRKGLDFLEWITDLTCQKLLKGHNNNDYPL